MLGLLKIHMNNRKIGLKLHHRFPVGKISDHNYVQLLKLI